MLLLLLPLHAAFRRIAHIRIQAIYARGAEDARDPCGDGAERADELREGRVREGDVQSVCGWDAGRDVDCGVSVSLSLS